MNWLNTYQFADAWVLWFLCVIPLFWVLYFWRKSNINTVFYATVTPVSLSKYKSSLGNIQPLKYLLRTAAVALCIIALARPQSSKDSPTYKEQYKEGIDIMIALDASGSMLSQDFKPDRFEASKIVAQEFAAQRKNDRLGLVLFEGEAYTQCPLTSDSKIIQELIGEAKRGVVQDGTAIGMGLATAVNRLRDSKAKSKVIILLTDGVSTHGKIHPLAAAEMAKEFGIRVYTIGVGTNGLAKTPVGINPVNGSYIYDYMPVEIDEATLESIADDTNGKYFRATDNETLQSIYKEIDLLEKEKFKSIEYELDLPEHSMPLIFFALIFIGIEILLGVFFKSLS